MSGHSTDDRANVITAATVVPRPAATVLVLRDSERGPEVLMVRRTPKAKFMPGSWVFPGGALDQGDAQAALSARCVGLTDSEASERLGLAHGGLAWYVAAIRECFEECGLLLAVDAGGENATHHALARAGLLPVDRDGTTTGSFAALCASADMFLACGELAYVAHWITPEELPKRFDTRFFICRAPSGQVPSLADGEHTDMLWIRPEEALHRSTTNELPLQLATKSLLAGVAHFENVSALLRHAQSLREIPTVRPARRPAP